MAYKKLLTKSKYMVGLKCLHSLWIMLYEKEKLPENWCIKVLCTGWGHQDNGCGARLKVFREDLKFNPGDKNVDPAVTLKCIGCGELTNIGMEYYPVNHKRLKRIKR